MSNSPERWRVFCAIELPPDVRRRVVDYIASLRADNPAPVSWAREASLHITMKFIGDVDRSRISDLSRAAQHAAKDFPPFSLTLETTGSFPAHGTPRVLWIGITDPSGNLTKLHEELENELAAIGFAREERKFHPHLTIARQRAPRGSRTPAALSIDPQFSTVKFNVSELAIMRSELRPEGSRYTKLSAASFSGQL